VLKIRTKCASGYSSGCRINSRLTPAIHPAIVLSDLSRYVRAPKGGCRTSAETHPRGKPPTDDVNPIRASYHVLRAVGQM